MKNNIRVLTFLLSSILSLTSMANKSYEVLSPEHFPMQEFFSDEDRQRSDEIEQQIKDRGYYDTYSQYAVTLSNFEYKRAVGFTEPGSDPYFKNLRLSPSEFSMTFPFTGISTVEPEHILGFVPGDTAKGESLEKAQWTGVAAYFTDDRFGVCRYDVSDMPASNGKAFYSSSDLTFDINKKPTALRAEGSPESGFLYKVSWTGERYNKQLECANKKPFDKNTLKNLVDYAKVIDNDLPDAP